MLAHSVLAIPLVLIVVDVGAEELRHEPGDGGAQPRRHAAARFPRRDAAADPLLASSPAALLAFLTSFDEVIVALFVSGGENSTLTRNMFNALRDQIDPTIAAISTIMIVLSVALLSVAQMSGGGIDFK